MNYTLHHGDALEILPTLPSRSIDLIVTDPPYMIGAVSHGKADSGKVGSWGDAMNASRWFRDWYGMCRRVLKKDGALWTCLNWRSLHVISKAAADAGWSIESLAVWDKEWIGPGGSRGLRPSYELVALMCGEEFSVPDRGVADVWRIKVGSYKPNGHPAEKPERLGRKIIETSAKQGGVILDPFAGSGSFLRAGLDLGCTVIGIEAEERWIRLMEERLGQSVISGEAAA